MIELSCAVQKSQLNFHLLAFVFMNLEYFELNYNILGNWNYQDYTIFIFAGKYLYFLSLIKYLFHIF